MWRLGSTGYKAGQGSEWNPIAVSQTVAETLTNTYDGLKLGQTFNTGGGVTGSNGLITDHFYFCSPVCGTNPNAQTDVTQQIGDTYGNGNYTLQNAYLTYTCQGNCVNGK